MKASTRVSCIWEKHFTHPHGSEQGVYSVTELLQSTLQEWPYTHSPINTGTCMSHKHNLLSSYRLRYALVILPVILYFHSLGGAQGSSATSVGSRHVSDRSLFDDLFNCWPDTFTHTSPPLEWAGSTKCNCHYLSFISLCFCVCGQIYKIWNICIVRYVWNRGIELILLCFSCYLCMCCEMCRFCLNLTVLLYFICRRPWLTDTWTFFILCILKKSVDGWERTAIIIASLKEVSRRAQSSWGSITVKTVIQHLLWRGLSTAWEN